MDWYVVDKNYGAYLKQFDSRVGDMDYGDRVKLYIGILLQVNNINYYVPVSSPKPKHQRMKNQTDFHKLVDADGKLYAVINLNNMIPVPDLCIEKLTYDEIERYRTFRSEKDKINYIQLLQKEKACIDQLEERKLLTKKAERLYWKCKQSPDSELAKRCCNFQLLEEKAQRYSAPQTGTADESLSAEK